MKLGYEPVKIAGVLVYGPVTTGELSRLKELVVSDGFGLVKFITVFPPDTEIDENVGDPMTVKVPCTTREMAVAALMTPVLSCAVIRLE